MPIVASATHQAWVRVPPPRRKPVRKQPRDPLSSPLAYFACRPSNSPLRTKELKQPCNPYDDNDDDDDHHHERRRAASAPHHAPEIVDEDDAQDEGDGYHRHENRHAARANARAKPRNGQAGPARAVSSQFQSAIFRAERGGQQGQREQRGSGGNRNSGGRAGAVSSSWSNATKALDL